jgi:hypothetical protein
MPKDKMARPVHTFVSYTATRKATIAYQYPMVTVNYPESLRRSAMGVKKNREDQR